mmetsp:Transcript_78464/g.151601  ORF Transcript_78464/g.151601 Transcript_78464/m.151601 type:complete len:177 (+) Transcript_78464:142-672(+)
MTKNAKNVVFHVFWFTDPTSSELSRQLWNYQTKDVIQSLLVAFPHANLKLLQFELNSPHLCRSSASPTAKESLYGHSCTMHHTLGCLDMTRHVEPKMAWCPLQQRIFNAESQLAWMRIAIFVARILGNGACHGCCSELCLGLVALYITVQRSASSFVKKFWSFQSFMSICCVNQTI